jgi:hypothetical protein
MFATEVSFSWIFALHFLFVLQASNQLSSETQHRTNKRNSGMFFGLVIRARTQLYRALSLLLLNDCIRMGNLYEEVQSTIFPEALRPVSTLLLGNCPRRDARSGIRCLRFNYSAMTRQVRLIFRRPLRLSVVYPLRRDPFPRSPAFDDAPWALSAAP